MPNIQIKRSAVSGVAPTNLSAGEPAANTTDERVFIGKGDGSNIVIPRIVVSASPPSGGVDGDIWLQYG